MDVRARFGFLALLSLAAGACKGKGHPEGIVSLSAGREVAVDAATEPKPSGARLGAIKMAALILEKPDRRSAKLGYLRAGGTVVRGDKPAAIDDCPGGYYRVLPAGYVCAGDEATTDLKHPILRALTRRPDLSKPLPYAYAFVRSVAPNYYRVPTRAEQLKYEMSLKKHLKSYARVHKKWNAISVGANDLPLDEQGGAKGAPPSEPPELTENAIFGGSGDDAIPWFFQGGRKIPNISSFKAPDFAVITNRIARHAGIALIDSFVGEDGRRFAMTTDARLIPASKLKPERGSVFHGVEMSDGWELPLAFVQREGARRYQLNALGVHRGDALAWHSPVQLTGLTKQVRGDRYVELKGGDWARVKDVAVASKPGSLPSFAKDNRKWIDIGLLGQTLVLYEGNKPVYVTAVATGRDGLGDPKTTHSTIRGTFKIREKHVTTTMDSHEVDNKFELRDVPWVQYFEGGYAIHAATWHDDFGRPRSHGCINMSPIDARRVFMFTDPPLPADWHAVYSAESTGEGTIVHIRP